MNGLVATSAGAVATTVAFTLGSFPPDNVFPVDGPFPSDVNGFVTASTGAVTGTSATLSAAGVAGSGAGAVTTVLLTVAAAGQVAASTGVALPVLASLTADGYAGVSAGASTVLTFATTPSGRVDGPGAASPMAVTTNLTAAGTVATSTGAATACTLTLNATGVLAGLSGAASIIPIVLGTLASGSATGGAATSVSVSLSAAGSIPGLAGAGMSCTLTLAASGVLTGLAAPASTSVTLGFTADGRAHYQGEALLDIGVSRTARGGLAGAFKPIPVDTEVDIDIIQGATFSMRLTWADQSTDPSTPIPLAGYRAHMQVRARPGGQGEPMLNLCSIPTDDRPTPALTVEPGGETGVIWLRISAEDTELLRKNCFYDLFIVNDFDPSDASRLVRGAITVSKSVTINTDLRTDTFSVATLDLVAAGVIYA